MTNSFINKMRWNRDKRNAAFKAMSIPERRVAVAKDCLAALDAKYITADPGVYVRVVYSREKLDDYYGQDLQEVLLRDAPNWLGDAPNCECCARGALLLAKVCAYNNYQVSKFDVTPAGTAERSMTTNGLADCFDIETLALIECAFEMDASFCRSSPLAAEAAYLYCEYNAEDRLRAICQNIIDNNGDFVTLT